ncbi:MULTISPECIES: hypothetical protein [Mesorhizobium]|uniref:hypothetical protein n=1 Tax=Mesorhizobium TaxID=68287 RepID=UPI0010103192|nr:MULTISPECIES: hypothetical protein [Mesorhizobium]
MNTVQRIRKAATADLLRIFGALGRSGCCGDFPPSLSSPILFAANDSIFLIGPVAVLHRREEDDLDRNIPPAALGDFERTPLSGRGGGKRHQRPVADVGVAIERSRNRNPVKRGFLLKQVRSRCHQLTASLSRTCRRQYAFLTLGETP